MIMSKYVLILTLVLLAPSAFAVETQQATSGVGRASIEAQSNAGRGSGEEFTAFRASAIVTLRSPARTVRSIVITKVRMIQSLCHPIMKTNSAGLSNLLGQQPC